MRVYFRPASSLGAECSVVLMLWVIEFSLESALDSWYFYRASTHGSLNSALSPVLFMDMCSFLHPLAQCFLIHCRAVGEEEREWRQVWDRCWAWADSDQQLVESLASIGHRAFTLPDSAGPLWMEIISKLLQEAEACQKTLPVKVTPLQRSLHFHTFIVLDLIRFTFHLFFSYLFSEVFRHL